MFDLTTECFNRAIAYLTSQPGERELAIRKLTSEAFQSRHRVSDQPADYRIVRFERFRRFNRAIAYLTSQPSFPWSRRPAVRYFPFQSRHRVSDQPAD